MPDRRLLAVPILLAVPATALAVVAVPEASDKAMAYYYTRNWLWALGLAGGLILPALFLFTGWSARIRNLAHRMSSRWAVRLLVYLLVVGALAFLLGLPFNYYEGFVVEHQFGLSNQTLAKWAADSLIAFGVSTVIGFLLLFGLYWLLARSPQRWWLYMGLASVPFVTLLLMVAPIWIEPLFNKFGPMKDRALEAKILTLASQAGIEGGRVFEVEKSVDTKKMGAYVNGFGDTKRIVFWDTLLKRMDEPEVMFVLGHEMGHYVLGHVWKSILAFCALITLSLYGAHRLSRALIERHRGRFGFDRLDDIASWPLINLVATLVVMVAAPVFNAYVRYNEHEADRFGLEIARNNDAAATAFVKLQSDNLANPRPHPLIHLLRDDHPRPADRIEFANTYRPWEKCEPLVYGEIIRK